MVYITHLFNIRDDTTIIISFANLFDSKERQKKLNNQLGIDLNGVSHSLPNRLNIWPARIT